jgi:hypothetical protein
MTRVTLASMTLGLYVGMSRKKNKKLWQVVSWRLTFLSAQENGV